MEKKLEMKNIPWGYELCFNDNCQQREKCLHYLARQVQTKERLGGPAVYPAAWESGECKRFSENKLTPGQQQDILQILAKFGPTDDLAFDHYETDFNFA